MKQGKSKADALFTATKKKDKQFLIEKDTASEQELQDWEEWEEDQRATAEAGEFMYSINRYIFSAAKP